MQRLLATTLAIYLAGTVSPFFAMAEEPGGQTQLETAKVADPSLTKELRVLTNTIDWQMHRDGTLTGQLVDRFGNPLAKTNVVLAHPKGKVGATQTDARGQFIFGKSPTGALALMIGKHVQTVRIWDADAAPPIATNAAMIVVGDVVLAQSCEGGPNCSGCDACGTSDGFQGHFGGIFQRMLQNPWLVGAGTAAAIAVPLALDDDDERDGDDAPPAS